MAIINDPRALSYTEEEIANNINPYAVATPPPPKVVVAERGDDFLSLASKLDVDVGDFVRANQDTDTVSAGAAYTVPQPEMADFRKAEADMDVRNEKAAYDAMHRINLEPGQTLEKYLDAQKGQPDIPPGGAENWFQAWVEKNSNLEPGERGTPEWAIDNPIVNFFRDMFGFMGIGTGAGIMAPGITGGQSPIEPFPAQALPRQRADTTVVSPTDPRANRPTNRQAYYAGDIPRPGSDEYYDWLVENSPYQPGTSEFFGWANQMEGFAQVPVGPLSQDYAGQGLTAEEKLRQDWENIYMNPENRGRGSGIVGWIEERTGLDISPEEFFTGDRSEELLSAIMNEFRPDELAYLESQGILVPEDGPPLPVYGRSGGDYSYPAYYGSGNGGSGPTYKRTPVLGLTSWSI